MSGLHPVVNPPVLYVYDGTFDGFLCCVFESVYEREVPLDILPACQAPLSLLEQKHIVTNLQKAKRVFTSIPQKISEEGLDLIQTVFLSCLPQKELLMLRFLHRGYQEGSRILCMLGDKDVAPLLKAAKHLHGEAHLLKGFVRFSDYDGALAAVITPKNFILPFIASHFIQRYAKENFLIFDRTNKAALVWEKGVKQIIALDNIAFPQASPAEEQYRALWKHFYNTVAIEARTNPRCRMTHMPKRYWENMLEVQDLLN